MAYLQSSAYCPTQLAYMTMFWNTTSHALVGAGTSGYQSLYSERRDFDLLDVRKETLVFYPKSDISTADIAAAGFYYTGDGYIVKCFCCKLSVKHFNSRDKPFAVHRSRAPNCPFVRRTVTQGGVAETAIDGEEDMVGLNSDVEDDELLEEHNGSCGVSKKEMGMTAKHLQLPAALISKLSLIRGCVNLSYTLDRVFYF